MTRTPPSSSPRLGDLPPTLSWVGGADGCLRIVDQTRLPHRTELRDCHTAEDVWEAIRVLRVRGAPAIGVAAAFGLCLGTRPHRNADREAFLTRCEQVGSDLCGCRPTAVNLAWAVQRMLTVARTCGSMDTPRIWDRLLAEAHAIAREDAEVCRRIGELGADLIPDGGGVLTHCNAGALATAAWGTALALMYVAHERGRRFRVFVDETRPLLQGARLTCYELEAAGIDVTLLCDGAAASLLKSGRVQLVVTGADRVARNGDVANKIGTLGVALAARQFAVPFYVAAPCSTFDRSMARGDDIPIEQRSEEEVRRVLDQPVAPDAVACYNPAFDVTPAELIAGIVTEKGIIRPVSAATIARVLGAA